MATDYRPPTGSELATLDGARMIADGIPYPDLVAAAEQLRNGADWFDVWAGNGRRYEEIGQLAIDAGDTLTGGAWLWQACINFHYAQFLWFHDRGRREEGQRRKVDLYRRAAEHLRPPSERVDIPFGDVTIPAYLRLPADAPRGGAPLPCVLLIGGLESTKEESYLFENMCLDRGMATFAFDGPGQGELFFELGLQPDFERYSSAAVDYVETRPEIDSDRIGVLGRSLGGYYAVRAAACDPRLKACVSWGACFDLTDLDDYPPATQAGFLYVTGIEDPDASREQLGVIDLRDVAGDLTQPTYVLHALRDEIFSMRHVDLLREHASNASLEVVVEENGNHCAHNLAHLVRPRMADWLAGQLGATR
jgi:2,6-dihydroxypseudooxynicotine hydrolase